jgi:hypothetical protein
VCCVYVRVHGRACVFCSLIEGDLSVN